MIKIIFILILIGSIAVAYNNQHHWEISNLKRQLFESLIDELDQNQEREQISYANDDYEKFFGSSYEENESKINSKSKQKRFLGIFKKLFNKTTSKPHQFDEYDNFADFEIPTTTKFTTKSTTKSKFISEPKTSSSNSKETDDVFYKLKQHCSITYDRLCSTKKQELYNLVKKCEQLKLENMGKKIEACDEVLSIYCYVFYDTFVCFGSTYEKYQPGKKPYTSSSTTPTKPATTKSTIRIPVIVVTSTKSGIITTSSTTTTRSTTSTRMLPITTTTTTTKQTTKSSSKPSVNNDLVSPFNGQVTSIPNDAEKLKQIGNYCLKVKQKDINCDKMLALLKDKFKVCEKKPKTDSECQNFKMNFCSAFPNFPCCPDVLAGRQCDGKSNTLKRSYLNLYN